MQPKDHSDFRPLQIAEHDAENDRGVKTSFSEETIEQQGDGEVNCNRKKPQQLLVLVCEFNHVDGHSKIRSWSLSTRG